jgi:hypothetical protein
VLPRSASIKRKLSGDGRQLRAVFAPAVLLTLSILKLKSVPDPFSGVTPSFTKADMRRVFVVPGPLFRILPATVQPLAVRPAAATNGEEKVATEESKAKSAWKPT